MPIAPHSEYREKNAVILAIQDMNGRDVIKIRENGDVNLDDDLKLDQAALEFWQGVCDYLPADKETIVKDKIMLIKTFAKFREIMESSKVTKDSLYGLFEELQDHFLRA